MSKLLLLILGLFCISCATTKPINTTDLNELKTSKTIVIVLGEKYLEKGQATFGENTTTGLAGALNQDTLASEVNQKIRSMVLEYNAVDLTREFGLPIIKEKFNKSAKIHSSYISIDELKKTTVKDKYEYNLEKFKKMGYDHAIVVQPVQYGVFRPVRIIAYRPFGIASGGVSIVDLATNDILASSKPRIQDMNKVETGWKDVNDYKTLRAKIEESYSYVMNKAFTSLIQK